MLQLAYDALVLVVLAALLIGRPRSTPSVRLLGEMQHPEDRARSDEWGPAHHS